MTFAPILPALLPAALALPLAWRSRAYREPAALLGALAGLALVRLATWQGGPLLAGAAGPYHGATRWAWAVDGAAVLAGAALRTWVAWLGAKTEPSEAHWICRPVSAEGSAALCTTKIDRPGAASRRSLITIAAFALLSSALWVAYPWLRGAPWLLLARVALILAALAQVLAGPWWAFARTRGAGVTPREWTALAFVVGARGIYLGRSRRGQWRSDGGLRRWGIGADALLFWWR